MRRRYKTNLIDSLVEYCGDTGDHLFELHPETIRADLVCADLVILTINTLEITIGKKYVAYPVGSAYGRFFALMNANRGDVERTVTFTISQFATEPVGMTVSRAKGTILKIF